MFVSMGIRTSIACTRLGRLRRRNLQIVCRLVLEEAHQEGVEGLPQAEAGAQAQGQPAPELAAQVS